MTTVLVSGALANKAGNGGAAWTRLSWAMGLRALGFDVVFVEELAPGLGEDAVAFFSEVTSAFDLDASLLRPNGENAVGRSLDDLRAVADDAAMLVNISGHLTRAELTAPPATRVFIDLDPGWTQLWDADGAAPLAHHDHWYTVGTALGNPRCNLPTRHSWRPVHQPVLLDQWPEQPPAGAERFTTVGGWRGFGTMYRGDQVLGPKAHEFRRFLELPRLAPGTEFELALAIDPRDDADRIALVEHGWTLTDPEAVAGDPMAFRRYVQHSPAEFSAAQGMYVRAGTGWFADRTVRYLASGRPAVVQDTGWSSDLPSGEGLIGFSTLDGVLAAVTAVQRDPELHSKAARALAEEHFAAEVVLGRLCEEVGVDV